MKNILTLFSNLILASVILAAANPKGDSLQEKWTKAFEDARREFQNSNDTETAEFAGKILTAVKKPGGLEPAALAANAELIKQQVRKLVQRGALESAATLNWAQWLVLNKPSPEISPADNNRKTGGKPGAGGLVLYLPFDAQDEGGVIRDSSGAGNDGRVFGATWVAEGRFGGAYQFKITNLTDRIVIPNSDLLNPDHITVAAWIKTRDVDGFWNRIVDKHWNTYCLNLGGDYRGKGRRGKLNFESSAANLTLDKVMDDNLWHHVAAAYDGTTVSLFLDGEGKSRPAKTPKPLAKNGWDLCIGNSIIDYHSADFLGYDGLIDEVRIYNRALSAAEIKALANATGAGVEIAAPAAGSGPKAPAVERLKQLKQLFEQGLITKEDYDKKVKEIVDTL